MADNVTMASPRTPSARKVSQSDALACNIQTLIILFRHLLLRHPQDLARPKAHQQMRENARLRSPLLLLESRQVGNS
jgi:hypothetical protein